MLIGTQHSHRRASLTHDAAQSRTGAMIAIKHQETIVQRDNHRLSQSGSARKSPTLIRRRSRPKPVIVVAAFSDSTCYDAIRVPWREARFTGFGNQSYFDRAALCDIPVRGKSQDFRVGPRSNLVWRSGWLTFLQSARCCATEPGRLRRRAPLHGGGIRCDDGCMWRRLVCCKPTSQCNEAR
jgi:hypothetical protein